ncbi:hypothetical protein BH11MYX4_BH11MYX4_48070 [soil metagenome]
MSPRVLLAAAILSLTSGCATYTTTFHTSATPAPEPHERRTTVDALGGSDHFDLGKQCDSGWADLTFENRIGKGMTETWRCRAEEHAASAAPPNPDWAVP